MKKLIDLRAPKERFARSINVERDSGSHAIEGYLPVGRAVETIDRLAVALSSQSGEAALSVTGPYGSGKSSLALIVDSLLSGKSDPARRSAESLLWDAAPEVLANVKAALAANDADDRGFIRAVVTAQRESVARTVLRALHHGASRYRAPTSKRKELAALNRRLEAMAEGFEIDEFRPSTRQIRELVRDLSEIAPVLLLIDEFGKNLEAFAEAPGEGDLFLLQELAEWTRETSRGRLAVVTLQHMAFGDYADGATGVQRREWVKIQGRFEDIPFVDTPGQTRALVAASFETSDETLRKPLDRWAQTHAERLSKLGLSELAASRDLLADCWPLHPVSLAVLPDLCQRYGQNERTMFSFLASHEPRSVGRFLSEVDFKPRGELSSVTLARLYDYFIDSAASMVGVSADASRWIEIDTRIRDTQGLSAGSLRVLKTVGLLNLVSTGGTLRASRALISYAAADGKPGTRDDFEVAARLDELEGRGLLTFRDFADEYRVWQGSDFDLKSAIQFARRRLRDEPAAAVMERVLPLGPMVAARHSHETGTLRAFERRWLASTARTLAPLAAEDRGDGLVAYVLGDEAPTELVSSRSNVKPIVFATSSETDRLVEAAREQLAIEEVLATDDSVRDDWVIRKELSERRVAAALSVRRQFEAAFGSTSPVQWRWSGPTTRGASSDWRVRLKSPASAVLSEVADEYYPDALPLKNDLMNRHELSSQAAKARREVAEVMAVNEGLDSLGIQGFGPDKTLYLSLMQNFGLHGELEPGVFGFRRPNRNRGALPVWRALTREIKAATETRLNVADLYRTLALPPLGLREGVAPILLIAALRVHSDEFALYEHGTFRPNLSGDVCERLLRNPGNFELKCFGVGQGPRAQFVTALSQAFNVRLSATRRQSSVVAAIGRLLSEINMLPQYSKKTSAVSATAVKIRRVLTSATEPDVLLFEGLPSAAGHEPIGIRDRRAEEDFAAIAGAVRAAMTELQDAYPRLLDSVRQALVDHLRPDGDDVWGSLARRSTELKDKILDPRVRALATALMADMPDERAWLSYVAMQVAGTPPEGWSDDESRRFNMSMQDLGAAFLRVEALTADMRLVGGEFEALRVAVNSSRGGDLVRLVTIDPQRSVEVNEVLDSALRSLTPHGLEDDEARGWLLARLLEIELERTTSLKTVDGDGYGGDRRGKEETA